MMQEEEEKEVVVVVVVVVVMVEITPCHILNSAWPGVPAAPVSELRERLCADIAKGKEEAEEERELARQG
ncbi:hypothetical protein E2C01_087878 [Portunus trituberculatus]|uniref:Uncharacterized protein n=1 Tax=Portunus trituberculatus TaxID=210409 RepID=A0A5B7J9A9_PORTR|nr:hypothetical protein [Portunus trituberculatus]